MAIYKDILRFTNNNWDARPRTLLEFLNDNQLTIPDYQRPYSWEEIHVEALLKDIEDISSTNSDNSQWFLGCFYTSANSIDSDLMLLDGQQRFTTIYLLLINSISHLIESGIRAEKNVEKNEEMLELLSSLLYDIAKNKPKIQLVREIKDSWATFMKNSHRLRNCTNDNKKKLQDTIQKFKNESGLIARQKGVYSGQRISENLDMINRFYKTKFITAENYENEEMLLFIEKALYKLWLIEIPLTADSKSISIFEGLNNRGKALTLSDKLVFKAIRQIKWEDNKIAVRSSFYKLISRIERLGQYFTEDQFWKYYLMSELGKSITREDFTLKDYVQIFQTPCNDLDSSKEKETSPIFKLIQKLEIVLETFELIKGHGSDEYYQSVPGGMNDKYKVKAILKTLDKALLYRDFNGVLLIYLLRDNQPTIHISGKSQVNWNFLNGAFNIIRFSHLFGAFSAKQSNEYRNFIINAISSKLNISDANKWTTALKKKEEGFVQIQPRIQQEFFTNDSRKQNIFTIYLFMLLENHIELGKQDSVSHQHETIEHIFPSKWKEYWQKFEFSKNDLLECCDVQLMKIPEESRQDSIEKFLADTISSSDMTIGTLGVNEKECAGVELIGNKIVLDNEHNSMASNYALNKKTSAYCTAATVYPNIVLEEELESITEWNYEKILKNTIYVTDKIWDFIYRKKGTYDQI